MAVSTRRAGRLTPVQDASASTVGDREATTLRRVAATLAFLAITGYALAGAPAQTRWHEDLRTLLTLGWDNVVTFVLMASLGLLPVVIAALMLPSMASGNQVPMWPFLGSSLFIGIGGLLPYLVAWQPPPRGKLRVPPHPQSLTARRAWLLRATESRWLPALLLALQLQLAALLTAANDATWAAFWAHWRTSRLVHMALIDAAAQAALAAGLCVHDARLRGAAAGPLGLVKVLPLALLAPLVGPTVYLAWRPITRAPRRRGDGGGVLGRAAALSAWLRARTSVWVAAGRTGGFRHTLRRVMSFVLQGQHIERERRPVRQYSVASDHGVADDDAAVQAALLREQGRAEVQAEPPAGAELDVADMDAPSSMIKTSSSSGASGKPTRRRVFA